MRAAPMRQGRQLGFSVQDLDGPLARWWNPVLPALAPRVLDALAGPIAPAWFPALSDVAAWLRGPRQRPEDGYTVDGPCAQVMVRTELPGVTPAMIDWWFAWHSDEPARYKLWHPQAHVHAQWARRPPDPQRCVGGVSVVDEYLGHQLGRFSISFVEPRALGFVDEDLRDATVIAARVGLPRLPIEAGTLVHEVRPRPGGSSMRSFFWLGGRWARARVGGPVGDAVVRLAAQWLAPTLDDARALLLHCAQEMSHLATFLPSLHAAHARARSGTRSELAG